MENVSDSDIIKGEPTKEFFIHMLTRDISLIQAIADLLDNCIDGARRLRPDGDYKDLWVRIEASEKQFKVSDNCGGISVDIARKYAFRFGRPDGMPPTSHSIGQFGVGMKRALFKIGYVFEVSSTTDSSRFTVRQDVREWAAKKDSWDFKFSMIHEATQPLEIDRGTTILVSDLLVGVSAEFKLENFRTRLSDALSAAHQEAIRRGIAITLNGEPLRTTVAQLLRSSELVPSRKTMHFGTGINKVQVILHCGLGESEPSAAGWNVFCNGRLVLKSDRSRITGWGDGVPQYHNEYARFRGYAYFDADNSSLLPWTTTKSDVNEESEFFQAARNEMIVLMRPVIDFLIRVAAEKRKALNDDPTPLETTLRATPSAALSTLGQDTLFASPRIEIPSTPRISTQSIQYSKPTEEIDTVKKSLGVRTLRDVGEKTFDYYFKMECK